LLRDFPGVVTTAPHPGEPTSRLVWKLLDRNGTLEIERINEKLGVPVHSPYVPASRINMSHADRFVKHVTPHMVAFF